MPILEIEIVLRPEEILAKDLAQVLAASSAEILRSQPRGTWVKLRTLDSKSYAENKADDDEPLYPVFVTVLKSKLDEPALEAEASLLAKSVAGICNRPLENVHILYLPEAQGRIAFGGRLR